MKKSLVSFAIFLALSISMYAENGFIFVRTLRGDAEISIQNTNLKEGEVMRAKNAEISVKNEGFASFALSNYSSGIVLAGKVLIKKFEQEEVQTARLPLHSEMASSQVEIYIDEGEVVFARGEFRPTSSFKIKTKFGVVEPVGNNIKVKVEKDKMTVWAYDAAIRYSNLNSTEQEYIPIGYELVCSLEKGTINALKNRVSIVIKEGLKSIVSSALDVFKTSEFFKDKDGKISARRIAFKNFFIRTPKAAR